MFVEVEGKGQKYILNVEAIEMVAEVKGFTLVKVRGDNKPIWLNPAAYDALRSVILSNNSNDLKEAKVTVRQPRARKTHARDYHKPANIPHNHVFVGLRTDVDCEICTLPFQHPCHNTSNPIDAPALSPLAQVVKEHIKE